jgi:hypothetical protein
LNVILFLFFRAKLARHPGTFIFNSFAKGVDVVGQVRDNNLPLKKENHMAPDTKPARTRDLRTAFWANRDKIKTFTELSDCFGFSRDGALEAAIDLFIKKYGGAKNKC